MNNGVAGKKRLVLRKKYLEKNCRVGWIIDCSFEIKMIQ